MIALRIENSYNIIIPIFTSNAKNLHILEIKQWK